MDRVGHVAPPCVSIEGSEGGFFCFSSANVLHPANRKHWVNTRLIYFNGILVISWYVSENCWCVYIPRVNRDEYIWLYNTSGVSFCRLFALSLSASASLSPSTVLLSPPSCQSQPCFISSPCCSSTSPTFPYLIGSVFSPLPYLCPFCCVQMCRRCRTCVK